MVYQRVSVGWSHSYVLTWSLIPTVVGVGWNTGFQWCCSVVSCYDPLLHRHSKEAPDLLCRHVLRELLVMWRRVY